jgi:hypothetical protein
MSEQEEVDDSDLTTPLIKPESFEFSPSVPASDIADFNKRDQKLLLGFYVIAQKVDRLIQATIETNRQQRKFEADLIEVRRWKKTLTMRYTLYSGIAVFIVTTMGSGILSKIADAIMSKFFP